jgi:hypothetical protein
MAAQQPTPQRRRLASGSVSASSSPSSSATPSVSASNTPGYTSPPARLPGLLLWLAPESLPSEDVGFPISNWTNLAPDKLGDALSDFQFNDFEEVSYNISSPPTVDFDETGGFSYAHFDGTCTDWDLLSLCEAGEWLPHCYHEFTPNHFFY